MRSLMGRHQGGVGWSYARVVPAIPGVGEVGFRETRVFLLEHGEWRLVQHHVSVGA